MKLKLFSKLFLLVSLLSQPALGQLISPKQVEVRLRDKWLASTLDQYIKSVPTKVIAILIERSNKEYTYTIYNVETLNFIKRHPTSSWGIWKGHTLLFYSGFETIVTMQDSTLYKRLIVHINSVYASRLSSLPKKVSYGVTELPDMLSTPSDGTTIWRLKTKDNGKLITLEDDIYTDDTLTPKRNSIKIPYSEW